MFRLKQNIGLLNAFLRMTCGFTLLSWSTAKLVRRPCNYMALLLAMLGAMKVASGALRFCPVKFMMGFKDIFAFFPKPKKNEFEGLEELARLINPS
ncbi:YgaP family membrane protein [Priestia taiwanensis]|uniref:YgaP family membrane protein n=1 Tax=Priestia taiwanensis TaxID=1347902 RepID=UPI001E5D39B3|nr:DUF2892 domain-containing protein [Priestia taiwanensis]